MWKTPHTAAWWISSSGYSEQQLNAATRYHGGENVSFTDGHAKFIKRQKLTWQNLTTGQCDAAKLVSEKDKVETKSSATGPSIHPGMGAILQAGGGCMFRLWSPGVSGSVNNRAKPSFLGLARLLKLRSDAVAYSAVSTEEDFTSVLVSPKRGCSPVMLLSVIRTGIRTGRSRSLL